MLSAFKLRFASAGFNPLTLSPALWLDGADASTMFDATTGGSLVATDGSIARWEDKSGNGRHATQGTVLSRPQRKDSILNGRGCVRFDGSNDAMGTSFSMSPSYCIFLVSLSRAAGSSQRILQASTGNVAFDPSRASASCFINAMVRNASWVAANSVALSTLTAYSGQNYQLLSNGTDVTAGAFSAAAWGTLMLNGTASRPEYSNCDMFELIITGQLTVAQRQQMETYLREKWGIAP